MFAPVNTRFRTTAIRWASHWQQNCLPKSVSTTAIWGVASACKHHLWRKDPGACVAHTVGETTSCFCRNRYTRWHNSIFRVICTFTLVSIMVLVQSWLLDIIITLTWFSHIYILFWSHLERYQFTSHLSEYRWVSVTPSHSCCRGLFLNWLPGNVKIGTWCCAKLGKSCASRTCHKVSKCQKCVKHLETMLNHTSWNILRLNFVKWFTNHI